MKKSLILSLIGIFALIGCDADGMDTMSCTYENTSGSLTTKMRYDVDYVDTEVRKVKITYDYSQNGNVVDNNNGVNGNTDNDTNTDTDMQNRMGDNNNGMQNGDNGSQNGNQSTNGNQNNVTGTNSTKKDNILMITDGVGTGTDGTTNDTQIDNDGIIDGVVGNAIDSIVGGVTDVILDIAGLKDRHTTVQNRYGNMNGFSVQNMTDTDSNYRVSYVIDYDKISDNDLGNLNLSRNINTLRDTYTSQGFTCSK